VEIKRDYDLSEFNSFGVSARAKFFAVVENEEDLQQLFSGLEFKKNKKLFLGGGSNILFTQDFDGIVIFNQLKGIKIISENEESASVCAMSGEVWQDLVEFAVKNNLWGIENMSYIPGSVGAAPMQNIGAYGQELKDVFENLEAYDLETGEKKVFSRDECGFGYRDSCFKGEFKGKYFVSAVIVRLNREEERNLEYKGLKNYFIEKNINNPSLREISDAVGEIRQRKLPDPKVIGNAGSFFKNSIVSGEKLKELLAKYPDIPNYPDPEGYKIPSAWLIEKCDWKGERIGNVGVHKNHALVLVNYGGGTGAEIKSLAEQIIASVHEKFGIILSSEVNLI